MLHVKHHVLNLNQIRQIENTQQAPTWIWIKCSFYWASLFCILINDSLWMMLLTPQQQQIASKLIRILRLLLKLSFLVQESSRKPDSVVGYRCSLTEHWPLKHVLMRVVLNHDCEIFPRGLVQCILWIIWDKKQSVPSSTKWLDITWLYSF